MATISRPIEDFWGFAGTANEDPETKQPSDKTLFIFRQRKGGQFGVDRDVLVDVYLKAKELPNNGSTKSAGLVAQNALMAAWRETGFEAPESDGTRTEWDVITDHIVQNGFVAPLLRQAIA